MKKTATVLVIIFLSLFIFSCDKTTESDTEAPTVSITYPANDSEFAQGTVITITADANDNKGIKEVKFYIDGTFTSTDDSEPYEYEWDTGAGKDTNHTIYAKAYDTSDNEATSDIITVTLTEGTGNPPNPPSNPSPADNATSISTNTNLSWECSDPNGDPLTFDVYFGTNSNPPLVNSGQSETTYDPGTLDPETPYYWKIKAKDDHSNSTIGDVWQFSTFSSGTGTVTDIDGNVYQTIIIGNQEWMMENLKVTRYRNGDQIPEVTDNGTWAGLSTGAWCNYNNDAGNGAIYGHLYNWYSVDEDDNRGLAPTGWHIPTDDEWQTLIDFLGGSAGGKMKETGFTHWNSPNTGATNESGYSALPGGCRRYYGNFNLIGYYAYFWSSTEVNSYYARYRYVCYDNSEVSRDYTNKKYGFSIRCIRD